MIFEFESKIKSWEQACIWRKEKHYHRVAFTNGCFDLLHRGHISYLQEAKNCADFLMVGLNTDASIRNLKGPSRPIMEEKDRAFMLASLTMVDVVIIFDQPTPLEIIRQLKPDLHIKGGDYQAEALPEYNEVKSYGGDVKILSFIPGFSTTNIIKKILSA